ncbi:MAG: riboflavin synthase [Firmicutes bacterium]|nr:riboflavin synthase [Bacillota bacterium]
MFTGLVEELGRVVAGRDSQLVVLAPGLSQELKIGDSVAVNGVCLTVVSLEGPTLVVDVMPETWEKTNLSRLKRGDRVNLEGALRLGDRLGGHLVTGHVDGTAVIQRMNGEGNALVIEMATNRGLLTYIVPKGSVALDGISLTVVEVRRDSFTVSLIPHTLKATNLQDRRVGDWVNLEVDIIGKYVRRFLENPAPEERAGKPGVTREFLSAHGYL